MATTTESEVGAAKLPRVLSATDAWCVVVGSVIGSGIFIVPARVASHVPFLGGIFLVWVVGGLFSLAGALTLAELGAMLPSAGGPYVYLREAYGRLSAFLFGWTEFLVIRTGSIASLAAAFGLNFAIVCPAPTGINPTAWQTLAALAATIVVATVNVVGTRSSARLQLVGTVLKVGALGLIIALPFALGQADSTRLAPVGPPTTLATGTLVSGMMVALVSVLWTYDGWVNAAEMAEEIKDPGRNIPRALILGLFALIGLYLGVTLVYHLVLPFDAVAKPGTIVAADYFARLVGPRGQAAIALVIMASVFITLNGNALSGPRAYFAMARDGVFPHRLCAIHPRFGTPANAIIAQATWAVLLIATTSAFLLVEPPKAGLPGPILAAWDKLHIKPLYDVLTTYVIFGGTIFYGMSIASVFLLRVRRPDLDRPYRTWGYPATPILYTIASLLLLGSMLHESPGESAAGLLIVAAGVPAYFVFTRRRSDMVA